VVSFLRKKVGLLGGIERVFSDSVYDGMNWIVQFIFFIVIQHSLQCLVTHTLVSVARSV
jgi:hypothetical protein